MKKRIAAVVLCIALLLLVMPIPVGASTVVDTVKVTDLAYPTKGQTLPNTAKMSSDAYRLHSIDWYDKTAGKFMEPGASAYAGHVYEAVIWVEPADGYIFKSVDDRTHDLSCFVNGQWVQPIKAYEYKAWAMVELRLSFPEVPSVGWIKSVDLHPSAPEVGLPLRYFQISRPEYMGVVRPGAAGYTQHGSSWWVARTPIQLGDNYFQPGVAYRYYATLMPKAGYSFIMNPEVTVNGVRAEYNYEQEESLGTLMCVTYQFDPLPDTEPIAGVALQLPAPKANGTPDYTAIRGTGYESANPSSNSSGYVSGIRWSDPSGNSVSRFEEGVAYTVSVNLKTLEGYRFVTGLVPSVNGQTPEFYSTASAGNNMTIRYTFAPTQADHVHKESGWQNDGDCHYKVCTVCDEVLTLEAHSGGFASCNTLAECAVCGIAYGNFSDRHSFTQAFLPQGDAGHANICQDCNALSAVDPHVPGPEATETTPQKCTICGYVIQAAKNHTHKLTKVEQVDPTCTMQGTVAHYACDGCNLHFEDAQGTKTILDMDMPIPPNGHIAGDEWLGDDAYHWKRCTVCDIELVGEQKQLHEPDENGVCIACGYGQAEKIEPDVTQPQEETTLPPEVGGPGEKEPEEFVGGWVLSAGIAAGAIGAGGVGASIVYFWKKKQ